MTGASPGENRLGGDDAYGMPRYCVTAAVATVGVLTVDVVPMRTPEAIVTKGSVISDAFDGLARSVEATLSQEMARAIEYGAIMLPGPRACMKIFPGIRATRDFMDFS